MVSSCSLFHKKGKEIITFQQKGWTVVVFFSICCQNGIGHVWLKYLKRLTEKGRPNIYIKNINEIIISKYCQPSVQCTHTHTHAYQHMCRRMTERQSSTERNRSANFLLVQNGH